VRRVLARYSVRHPGDVPVIVIVGSPSAEPGAALAAPG
jgi:hypothetical protein